MSPLALRRSPNHNRFARPIRRGKSRGDFLLTLLAVFMAASGVYMLLVANSRTPNQPLEPERLTLAEGKELRSIAIRTPLNAVEQMDLRGNARVIYLFSTTCRFCNRQRKIVGEALSKLPPNSVITLSQEAPLRIANYWKDAGVALAAPLALEAGAPLVALGLDGVPALIFLRGDGRVYSAYVGTSRGWGTERYELELSRAMTAPSSSPVGATVR